MKTLLIKNAYVIDPIQDISGETMDIAVRDGKIVDDVKNPDVVIDAQGMLTLPGGIDSHTHICGTKVNFGRYMSPEDMRAGRTSRRGDMHATSGYSVPTTYGNSYRYSKMGYTTLLEGAMAPMEARHTHEEFRYTPMQDCLANTLFDGNWFALQAIQDGDTKRLAGVLAWYLSAAKGFGVKLTNPGGTEAWGFGEDVSCIHKPIPHFDITPREIIVKMIEANEMLNLPHSVHLHCNNLGKPGNYMCTLDTYNAIPDLNEKRQSLYSTHVQFHSYGGSSWNDFCSKAEDIAHSVNDKPHIVIDTGQVMFGKTTTMTADGPMEFNLYRLYHNKWSNHDVEMETGSGVIPVHYRKKNLVNAIMWSIGLELALLVDDPWQCILATDNPNGAPFVKYPEVMALLMSKKYRDEEFETLHKSTGRRVALPALERELTWNEIAVMTRSAQAQALGLVDYGKGHLSEGAEADIAIYPITVDTTDPTRDYERIINGFSSTEYTIKRGEVVCRRGICTLEGNHSTYWVKPHVSPEYDMSTDTAFIDGFNKYYSMRIANYPVGEYYIGRNVCMETEASI